MNDRQARKIVNRVQRGSVKHTSYPLPIVKRAFGIRGVELTEAHMSPWTEAEARRAEASSQAPVREAEAAQRRAAKAARIEARRKAKIANDKRIAKLEAERVERQANAMAFSQQQMLAAEGAREAFKQAVENEVDELPEAVEVTHEVAPETVGEADDTYAEMSVKDLKAECKARGLSGYSGLKRPELTAMLVVNDQKGGL